MSIITDIMAFIDQMLGDGATKKIMGDKSLGIAKALELMVLIANAVVEEQQQDLVKKYA